MDNKAFTLIELVLVISIIGILSLMMVPKFETYQLSALIATHNSNVDIIRSAAQMYLVDNPNHEGEEIVLDEIKKYIETEDSLTIHPKILEHSDYTGEEFSVKIEKEKIEVEPGKITRKNPTE